MKRIPILALALIFLGMSCVRSSDVRISSIVSRTQAYNDGDYQDIDNGVTIIYSYNEEGLISEVKVWSADSVLISNQILSYDEQSRIQSEEYYEKGKFSVGYSYTYEGKKHKTELMLSSSGTAIAQNEIILNRKGKPVSSVQTFLKSGDIKRTEYRYWPSGNLHKVTSHTDYTAIETNFDDEESVFDRAGNQISYHQEVNAANGVNFIDERYEYAFDRYKNWTEKTVYLNDRIVGRFLRTINY